MASKSVQSRSRVGLARNSFDRWSCPTQRAVERIGDKWTLFIIREFIFGESRASFNQLLRALKPISSRTLSLKLQKLQSQGVLIRKIVSQRPLKVEYNITPKGLALEKSLRALADWQSKFE